MRNFLSLLPSKWLLNAATLGPIGYWGKMPGTNGSFVGLLWYTLFFHELSPFGYFLMCLISTYLACQICTQGEIILQKKDPGCIILDEMVALPFCFIGLQRAMSIFPVWWYMIAGFLLFRVFDIFKPFCIKKLQELPGGLGVVMDDVVAALAVCICLHLGTCLL